MALGSLEAIQAQLLGNGQWGRDPSNYQTALSPQMLALLQSGAQSAYSPDQGYALDRQMVRSAGANDATGDYHWGETPVYSVRGINQNSNDTGNIYRYDDKG